MKERGTAAPRSAIPMTGRLFVTANWRGSFFLTATGRGPLCRRVTGRGADLTTCRLTIDGREGKGNGRGVRSDVRTARCDYVRRERRWVKRLVDLTMVLVPGRSWGLRL